MKRCTNCGALVKDDALWCPECGVDVGREMPQPVYGDPMPVTDAEVIETPSYETQIASQPTAFCPSCGNAVTPGAAFCSACGTPLNGGASQAVQRVVIVEKQVEKPRQEEPRRPRRRIIIPKEETNTLGIVSFVITMVGIIGFLFTSWLGFGLLFIFLAPLTLLLSFIAMFKKPRGFAVAAFILSLLELLVMLLGILIFGAFLGALTS